MKMGGVVIHEFVFVGVIQHGIDIGSRNKRSRRIKMNDCYCYWNRILDLFRGHILLKKVKNDRTFIFCVRCLAIQKGENSK